MISAAVCPPLQNIKHGSSVSDTETEALNAVTILCDDGYNHAGGVTKAICAPDSAGRAVWSGIPTCERRYDSDEQLSHYILALGLLRVFAMRIELLLLLSHFSLLKSLFRMYAYTLWHFRITKLKAHVYKQRRLAKT